MAVIDSKKLLPPSKSAGGSLATQKFLVPVSNIIPKSSAIIKAPQSSLVPSQDQGKKTLSGEIVSINKKALRVEEIISINTNLFKKTEENKRKSLEEDKFEKKEKQLEEKKGISFPGIKGPSLPKTGFLDSIKRFLFYTMLGYAFNKFGKYIPKVIELTTKLTPVFKFFEDFTGNLLNGVIEFIDKGYKAYDKVRELTKFVGGENAQKKFDEFSKQFNTFANLAIIAGMATMGGTDFGLGTKPRIPKGYDKFGKKAGQGLQQRYLERYGEKQFTKRFGEKNLQRLASKGAVEGVAKQGAKQSLRSLVAAPIIGSLIGFIIDTVIFREKPSRAAAGAVGSAIGQGLGIALAGGTTLGLGAGIGMLVGGFAGDWLGKALYDTIIGYNQKPIQGRAKGGEVTRGGKRVARPATRRIQQIKTKPPKIRPQKTIPGKDIGGKNEIKKLFTTTTDPKTKNPLGILESTSTNLKTIPMIGGLMGASLDLVMGQKPDRSVFSKIGNGFGVLIQNAINAETSTTLSNVQKEIVGLANGGTIPRTLSSNENIGMKIGERISRTLETMVNVKVNETLQALRKEFGKKGMMGETPYDQPPPGGEFLDYEISGGELPSGYPGRGTESHGYPGRDYQIQVGKAISVFNPGTVVYAGLNPSGYGNLVIIRHKNGKQSVYAHLSKINVREGDEIKEGEKRVIGLTGGEAGAPGAGNSTGPHLHFEVRDSRGNKITAYNDGDGYFRFGTVTGVRRRTPLELSKLPVEPTGQQLQGEISWYGPGFYGRKTANGEIFTGNEMTAAHKSLPFGTLVRVTWQGKSIVVRINDRGPFVAGRVLDLSRAAAAELGMSGVANGAKIEIVKRRTTAQPPNRDPRPPSTVPSTLSNGSGRTSLDLRQLGLKQNPKTGVWENASLAPAQSPNIASGLNLQTSYEVAGGPTLMLQRVIIEKPIPMPNRSSGFAPLDSSTASSSLTASLTIG